jgi:hypothetical protein
MSTHEEGKTMLWKILGIIVLVWIAFAVLGAVVKGLFWVAVAAAIVFGIYWLVKAIGSADNRDLTKL